MSRKLMIPRSDVLNLIDSAIREWRKLAIGQPEPWRRKCSEHCKDLASLRSEIKNLEVV
jgi:hypothetical protein